MPRVATPLVIADLSLFARNLNRALAAYHADQPQAPGHVALQNLIARSAGYRNLQALKAKPPVPAAVSAEPVASDVGLPLSENARRTLMQFDAEGRLVRWPTKFTVQRMAMWVLWTRFEAKRVYSESEVNTILRAANAFGDHATLRRELVNHKLLTRKSDCSDYRKLPARPDDEVRAMLTAWRVGNGGRARAVPPRLAAQTPAVPAAARRRNSVA